MVVVVEVPSSFSPSAAPIYFPLDAYLGKGYLRQERERDLMTVVKKIEEIANKHNNTRGIIHFPSYEWFHHIHRLLSPEVKERTIVHDSGTRNEKLVEFRDSPPSSILCAIKMEEGTDFPDEKARWQILVKTPYQDLNDEWVAMHKAQMGQEWYELSALQQVIQAAGRIVRSKDDWGYTYVLDRNALKLIRKYRSKCPDWFMKRLVVRSAAESSSNRQHVDDAPKAEI